MSYRVVRYFEDMQDNNHAYNTGDKFPRDGMSVSIDRINELASDQNKQHTVLIVKEDEGGDLTDDDFNAEIKVGTDSEDVEISTDD